MLEALLQNKRGKLYALPSSTDKGSPTGGKGGVAKSVIKKRREMDREQELIGKLMYLEGNGSRDCKRAENKKETSLRD